MSARVVALNGLRRQRPEWEPWLVVVGEILREAGALTWDSAVPATPHARGCSVPLLEGATLALQASSVRRLLKRLIGIASRNGTPKMATLEAAQSADVDMLPLFTASLCQDRDRIDEFAAASAADAEAFHAVVALLPVPLLHACNRRWASSISKGWVEGYCPVCGSWPAFAEVRGIERSRYFRCGRCGGEWHARALRCPYCDTIDHDELVALVPENGGENGGSNAAIDACRRCLGYVKTLTRLQGCPPDTVMIEDLATVDLDVAALEHGYAHPSGAARALDITVTEKGATRRFFAWSS
jgi:FdhE protein